MDYTQEVSFLVHSKTQELPPPPTGMPQNTNLSASKGVALLSGLRLPVAMATQQNKTNELGSRAVTSQTLC
jgi:hypothetical protein